MLSNALEIVASARCALPARGEPRPPDVTPPSPETPPARPEEVPLVPEPLPERPQEAPYLPEPAPERPDEIPLTDQAGAPAGDDTQRSA